MFGWEINQKATLTQVNAPWKRQFSDLHSHQMWIHQRIYGTGEWMNVQRSSESWRFNPSPPHSKCQSVHWQDTEDQTAPEDCDD
ncbi:unnamed protein product [Pleuronectes platessa]|uniref:Uncharacterized protein n=1 Tax=Pleuronectes platessa TaxID=8262 RepID=A0A9N7UZ68_PLEPL|nr:unnamed protein product [Pleuronectes platessa]